MGNNNSTSSGNVGPHPQWTPPQSHSFELDDPRSRMTKGYMSPRHHAGQGVSPQKVLPTVNPAKAAQKLKPTSNGLNLKQCGTISAGRKFNEVEVETPFGLSKGDVYDGRGDQGQRRKEKNINAFGLCRQNGMSSPNLMDENYRRDEESLLNSLINRDMSKGFHESDPEMNHHRHTSHRPNYENNMPISSRLPTSLIHESPAKKQIRSKKKQLAPIVPPPVINKTNLFNLKLPPPPPPIAQEITKVHQRMFKTKAEGRLSSSSEGNDQFLKKTSSERTDSKKSTQLKEIHDTQISFIKKSTSDVHNLKFELYAPHVNGPFEIDAPLMKNLKPISRSSSQTQKNVDKLTGGPKNYLPYSCSHEKEFNLGEKIKKNINYLPGKNQLLHNDSLNQQKQSNNVQQGDENNRKKSFYFGMELGGSLESKNSTPHHHHKEKIENVMTHAPPQKNLNENNSKISSQGFTYNFKQESLSDNISSSSEMDIVLRPTLPPKRQELPKFSPSAAWNRIELDSPNSSEEDVFGFNYRKESSRLRLNERAKPNLTERIGEGDSGISGLDENGGGGSPEILSPPLLSTTPTLNTTKGKCWTPEQDLDDSSSEFDAEEDEAAQNSKNETHYKSSERPRLVTTRQNFFSSSKSDTEGKDEPIYARSTKSKTQPLSLGPIDATTMPPDKPAVEFNLSLTRIINHRRSQQKERGLGLDGNWFLSRSEPNSLNMMELMIGNEARHGSEEDDEEEGIRSENGYAPTPLHFEMGSNGNSLDWKKSNSLISLSHIVYLPQQRSTHEDGTTKRNRKTKSVENLLKQSESQTVGSQTNGALELQAQMNNNKRKKFKFQSTLKVLERKQIEKELTREAEEKEMERLREIEAMKRVEAEFQKKRRTKELLLHEKDKLIQKQAPFKSVKNEDSSAIVSMCQWDERRGCVDEMDSRIRNTQLQSRNSSSRSSNNSRTPAVTTTVLLTQRQDPEGAPSILDLRQELIQESRKRHGNGISSTSSDLTQELSEYRQETRQYCDYRRSPRVNKDGSSAIRFMESSSSDIFPLRGRTPVVEKQRRRPKSTVVHPEIVCDIPNRPFPYMVNFSRLSGSHTSLHIEERPTSGIGYTSGPSSVISDNYRRDWAHNHSKASGSPIGNGGKASSITSLHSTSDNCRQIQHELNGVSSNESPNIFHRVFRPKSPGRKYQRSPAPMSPQLTPSSMSHKITTSIESTVNERGPRSKQMETCLQPQSFTNYKTKSYRPVIFNPNNRPQ